MSIIYKVNKCRNPKYPDTPYYKATAVKNGDYTFDELAEDIALATALAAQGHPVEFHLYPGAYHGSEELAPEASLSRRIVAARLDALRRAVAT